MDAVKFTEWIKSPEKVHSVDSSELKRLAHQYPYSQIIQLLYAIRLKNSSEHLFQQQLGRTSILTTDRTVLFNLFEGDGEKSLISSKLSLEKGIKLEEKESLENKDKPSEEAEVAELTPKTEVLKPHKKEERQPNNEQRVEKKPETKKDLVTSKPATVEEDFSKLSASERIKAILERSRKIQKEFDGKKKTEDESNERVKAIREKLEEIKEKNKKTETKPKKEDTVVPKIQAIEIGEEEEVQKVMEVEPIQTSDPTQEKELESAVQNNPVETPAPEIKIEEDKEIEKQPPAKDVIETTKQEFAPVFTIDQEEVIEDEEEQAPISEDEEHSFSGWLERLKSEKTETADKSDTLEESITEESITIDKKLKLFDSFVEKLPEIKKKGLENSTKSAKISVETSTNSGSLVTETLAKVYIQQGHLDKAIKAYQILKLKYPEKNGFFADRISEIKKLKNNK